MIVQLMVTDESAVRIICCFRQRLLQCHYLLYLKMFYVICDSKVLDCVQQNVVTKDESIKRCTRVREEPEFDLLCHTSCRFCPHRATTSEEVHTHRYPQRARSTHSWSALPTLPVALRCRLSPGASSRGLAQGAPQGCV